jgi:hypothetical protein
MPRHWRRAESISPNDSFSSGGKHPVSAKKPLFIRALEQTVNAV